MIVVPLDLGQRVLDIGELQGVDGRRYGLSTFRDREVLVLVFASNRCPTVKAYEGRMVEFQREYAAERVQLVAINSVNSYLYREESLPEMIQRTRERQFNFPYLKDVDQVAARRLGAVCTPHAFILDGERRLRYRGRIDDSRDPARATSPDIRNATDDILAGREVRVPETRPFGCAIDYMG